MAANVKSMFLCPKCNEGMSSDDHPSRCPNCSFRFRRPDEQLASEFSWAKSPEEQFYEIVQQDMEKFLDKPITEIAEELLPGVIVPEELREATLSNQKRLEIIREVRNKQKDVFFMTSSFADLDSWFKCLHYLMGLAIPSGNKENALMMAAWGKRLGTLANAIEYYFEAGGGTYEHKITTPRHSEQSN